MAQALTFFFIGSLLNGVLCGWIVNLPKTIEGLNGSCVTIPCSFEIHSVYNDYLDDTCKAIWKSKDEDFYTSFNPKLTTTKEMTGDLTRKDCTTTFNNVDLKYSNDYYFRLHCSRLKWTFSESFVNILVKADPPSPTLSLSTMEVKEGASMRLNCSAPAPCVSHPPTLTWTPSLGESQESLQDNQDKTKVMTSTLTFTASHLHHGKTISCTATYNRQDSTEVAANTSLTPNVSYSPKTTTVSVSPSGPVPEFSQVMLTCTSTANPAVINYTWYRADGGQDTFIESGHTFTIQACKLTGPFFCVAENDLGAGRSDISQLDVRFYVPLPVFITTVVLLVVLVCALLIVIRVQWTHKVSEGQCTGDTSMSTMDQLTRSNENEAPNTTDEAIYSNTQPSPNLPRTEANNAEEASKSSEKWNDNKSDVIYSTVRWKAKSKKKQEGSMAPSGSSYLEEERCTVEDMGRDFVSHALEMAIYDEVEATNAKKEVESEYSQVKFKKREKSDVNQ